MHDAAQTSAMVTSTSTPGSIEIEVICFTTSEGECKSMRRLWMRISQRSNVLVPSPHGDFLTHRRRVLVGKRTGPATCNSFSRAPAIRSPHTFSNDFTLRLVKVMRMRCSRCSSVSRDFTAFVAAIA
mmetsp:Transcript_469/g.422  ORF Transcript_469/g.422 Transcript_469/m.422 type:complete len:127 (-) Transcript_469:81-461(-)